MTSCIRQTIFPSTSGRLHQRTHVSESYRRRLSTTPSLGVVAPESPRFVDVPRPIQPRYPARPHVKGFLPVPRDLFPARSRHKTDAEYLEETTPEPSSRPVRQSASPPLVTAEEAAQEARREWKRQLASTRRRNLREGLMELSQRKQRTEAAVAADRKIRRAERQEAVYRKARDDERLTTPSVTQTTKQLQAGPLPDPARSERLAQQHANLRAMEDAHRQKRQQALHTLYMNARSFITTEADLSRTIEAVFVPNSRDWEDAGPGENIWNRGPPMTMQSMLASISPKFQARLESSEEKYSLKQRRLMRIGSELTGGEA